MKKTINVCSALLVAVLLAFGISSCGGNKKVSEENVQKSLNISVFLDLSDRLVRQQTPDQTFRDTTIVGYLCDNFKKANLGPRIQSSEDQMKVFFYPTPNDPAISAMADKLVLKMTEKEGVQKRISIEGMHHDFNETLGNIYSQTIKAQKWVGCDIWDFFSNKKVDKLCMKKGARNIIVILTDGYLFQADNKQNKGTEYNYILPPVLNVPNASLMVNRAGLEDLEVLMLEVNPYAPAQRDPMIKMLEDWFQKMGVKHFEVAETDANMSNTKTIIESFLN